MTDKGCIILLILVWVTMLAGFGFAVILAKILGLI